MANKLRRCTEPGCRKLTANALCDTHSEPVPQVVVRPANDDALTARLRAGLAMADQDDLDRARAREHVALLRNELIGLNRAAHRADTCNERPIFKEEFL